jgi:hypothetical protein
MVGCASRAPVGEKYYSIRRQLALTIRSLELRGRSTESTHLQIGVGRLNEVTFSLYRRRRHSVRPLSEYEKTHEFGMPENDW